jgi:hypothetical protein
MFAPDMSGISKSARTNVIQWGNLGRANQEWYLTVANKMNLPAASRGEDPLRLKS